MATQKLSKRFLQKCRSAAHERAPRRSLFFAGTSLKGTGSGCGPLPEKWFPTIQDCKMGLAQDRVSKDWHKMRSSRKDDFRRSLPSIDHTGKYSELAEAPRHKMSKVRMRFAADSCSSPLIFAPFAQQLVSSAGQSLRQLQLQSQSQTYFASYSPFAQPICSIGGRRGLRERSSITRAPKPGRADAMLLIGS